jgi:hypothetical protein
MNSDPQMPHNSRFRNPFIYSSIAMVIVAAYVAFVLLSRYESTREFERRNAEKQAEERREDDRLTVEQLGGSELAIRALYVAPSAIRRGASAQICYDVGNAKSVTLNPPEAEVWPSHSRCFYVSPKQSTTYTLTITDAAGKRVMQSVEVHVR